MHGSSILVVAGSVRPNRRALKIAAWIGRLGAEASGRTFEIVDLRTLGLAMDDEPGIPAKGDYACETTRRWSEMVGRARGVVLVTPQYNWGYPAALKNAIDHLHGEWRDKPVLVVTYGGHGGERCQAQLREVLTGLRVRQTAASPKLTLSRARIEADDGEVDPDADFHSDRPGLDAAIEEFLVNAG